MKFTCVVSALLLGLSAGQQNVVDVAVEQGFTVLAAFATAAELVDTLATTQGITVFAPTDEAFLALGATVPDVVANLNTPQWQPHLQDVLAYHVVPSEVPSSAVTDGLTANALNGEALSFTVNDEGVFVNENTQVTVVDVAADNGIIHVVDSVLIPSWVSNSIVDRAVASPDLTTLVDLVVKAELAETLSGAGPYTVFAPTDAAFVEFLGEGADTSALDTALVTDILTYHVVEGIYTASQVTDGLTLTTIQGEDITFTVADSAMVNGETIVATDILANNGIVHVIDGVLSPPKKEAADDMSSTMEDETTMEKEEEDSHDSHDHDSHDHADDMKDDMKDDESAGVAARVAAGAASAAFAAAAVLLF